MRRLLIATTAAIALTAGLAGAAAAAVSCARTATGAPAHTATAQTVETSRRRMETLPENQPGTITAQLAGVLETPCAVSSER